MSDLIRVRSLTVFEGSAEGRWIAVGDEFEVLPARAAELQANHLVERLPELQQGTPMVPGTAPAADLPPANGPALLGWSDQAADLANMGEEGGAHLEDSGEEDPAGGLEEAAQGVPEAPEASDQLPQSKLDGEQVAHDAHSEAAGDEIPGEVLERPDDAAPGEQIDGQGLPPAAEPPPVAPPAPARRRRSAS